MSEKDEKATTTKKIFKIELKIDEALAGGQYANICLVNHSDSEFILDSFFIQPGRAQATMKGRLILSPRNTKRLLMLLADQVKRYEGRFGEIDVGKGGPMVSLVN